MKNFFLLCVLSIVSLSSAGAVLRNDSVNTGGIKATRVYFTNSTGDSTNSTAINSSRFYYGIARGDTVKSYKDTSRIKVADSIYTRTVRLGSLTGASRLSADTISAVHLLNLRKHSGAHYSGDGDVYYDSLHSALEAFVNGNAGTVNRCIFAQSNVVTCSATVSETSLKGVDSILAIDFPALSDSLEANFFKRGKRLRYGIGGWYQSKATSAGTMIVRIKLNNVLVDSVVATLDNNMIEQIWRMDGAIVCAATGASGTVRTVTSWNHTVGGVMHSDPLVGAAVTVNTTIRQKFDLTFQFSDASIATRANMIKSVIFYLEDIH